MSLNSTQAVAIVKLTCAIQDNINAVLINVLNSSEINQTDIDNALIYVNRLKANISNLKQSR